MIFNGSNFGEIEIGEMGYMCQVSILAYGVFFMSKKRKMKHSDNDGFEEKNKEIETEDIYDTAQREAMLEDDEITAAEYGFMEGREQKALKKKTKRIEHDDSVSVELAKDEYQEDQASDKGDFRVHREQILRDYQIEIKTR